MFFIAAIPAQHLDIDFIQWSEKIESSTTTEYEKQKAVTQIIAMGKDILPLVQKKLEQTKNSHYFYILNALGNVDKKQTEQVWKKDEYFYQKYKKAIKLAEEKKYDDSIKIVESILILEPNISFSKDAYTFVEKLRKQQSPNEYLIEINVSPVVEYYSFTDKLKILISLKNQTAEPIVLSCGTESLDFKIRSKEFYISGDTRTDFYMESVVIKKDIKISAGGLWERIVTIPHHHSTNNCHQEMEIETNIKLVTVKKEGKMSFPKMDFPKCKLKIFPKKYHPLTSNPMAYFSGAIVQRKDELLFYSSFWIRKKSEQKAISTLIDSLDQLSLSPLVKSILTRFTKEDYSSVNQWKNWWYAHKSFYERE